MLGADDRARVAQAVTRAEAASDGEVVTVVAAESDSYHDVVLHWTVLLMLLGLALTAVLPALPRLLIEPISGRWETPQAAELVLALLALEIVLFLVGRLLFGLPVMRRLLTPPATATRRVRRRAVLLFRLAAENRTRARTGVLLYLSLAEHRAEIVADEAIAGKVAPEAWGEAMHALIDAVRDRRPADGMVAAVDRIGVLLTEHFPRSADDTNELTDRLILL